MSFSSPAHKSDEHDNAPGNFEMSAMEPEPYTMSEEWGNEPARHTPAKASPAKHTPQHTHKPSTSEAMGGARRRRKSKTKAKSRSRSRSKRRKNSKK